jgi:hypothetical protein
MFIRYMLKFLTQEFLLKDYFPATVPLKRKYYDESLHILLF